MMLRTMAVSTLVVAGFFTAPALADWDPGDPHKMHWPQLPDLTETGMDVYDTTYYPAGAFSQKWLADDWMCSESGPVTDIHIWGSWLFDQIPQNDATHGTFELAIYSDIPADPTQHSRPGDPLWTYTFGPNTYLNRRYATGTTEQFYDPNIDQIIGFDTEVWQYNFLIPETDAFVQEEGTIYWLAVTQYDPNEDGIIDSLDMENTFGWKTSRIEDRWNDDAVFTDAPFGALPGEPWGEMHYPSAHPYGGESLDLAFVITPEPATLSLLALGALVLVRRARS